jgi:hypothetical protein
MRFIFMCRRTFIATLAIGCLTVLGLCKDVDVSLALASIAAAMCSANAYEAAAKHKNGKKYTEE